MLRGSQASLTACVILLGAAARADEPVESADRARQLYAEGKAEYDLGHIAQALAKFEGAYRAKPVPGLLFNIAQCHRLLGDLKSAAMTYRAFLRNETSSAQAQKAAELLKQVEEAMERQSSAQKAPPLGLTQPEEKKPLVAVATPPPPPVVPAAVTHEPPAPMATEAAPRPLLWTYVAGGGAVLAAAGGTMFALKAHSASADLQSTPHSRAEIDRIEPQVRSDASKANLLIVTAGVLAGAAAVLWVLHF